LYEIQETGKIIFMKNIYDQINEKIQVIAEIGINHNGQLSLAEEMIDAAAEAGADAVKFQCFKTRWMFSRLTPGFVHTEADVFAQMEKLEVQDHWWPILKERAHKRHLYFSASVFDSVSLGILERTGIDFLKVASSEINNHLFLKEQKGLSDTYIISTGMALLEEIAASLHFLESIDIEKIVFLECTSSYPAPPESVHLLNIDFLHQVFNRPVGFSDHTLGIHYAMAAAARGARVIEKHFTLDKNMEGPDHAISADPQELRQLVAAVREIEQSLQSNQKMTLLSHEQNSRQIGRKSLIAKEKIVKGQPITRENTIIKRPGLGISPNQAEFIYGRLAGQDIETDQWITGDMII